VEDKQLRERPKVIHLSPQTDSADAALESKQSPEPGPSTTESPPVIDLTDDALLQAAVGEDFPVVVYLREQLSRSRAETDAAREEAEVERERARHNVMEANQARADQMRMTEANRRLEKALKGERRRADRLEARLARTLEKLESQRAGSKLALQAGKKRPRSAWGVVRRTFGKGRSTEDVVDHGQDDRIESLGKMAHLHKEMMERKGGPLTLGESLELRRIHYGANVRASASLFGRPNSKAILYRDVPEGARRSLNDPVRLTEEGERLATAYQQLRD
jgi:exonuclease VII large subunit